MVSIFHALQDPGHHGILFQRNVLRRTLGLLLYETEPGSKAGSRKPKMQSSHRCRGWNSVDFFEALEEIWMLVGEASCCGADQTRQRFGDFVGWKNVGLDSLLQVIVQAGADAYARCEEVPVSAETRTTPNCHSSQSQHCAGEHLDLWRQKSSIENNGNGRLQRKDIGTLISWAFDTEH